MGKVFIRKVVGLVVASSAARAAAAGVRGNLDPEYQGMKRVASSDRRRRAAGGSVDVGARAKDETDEVPFWDDHTDPLDREAASPMKRIRLPFGSKVCKFGFTLQSRDWETFLIQNWLV